MNRAVLTGCWVVVTAGVLASCGWGQTPFDESVARARLAAGEAETRELLMAHAKAIPAADAAYGEADFAPLLEMVRGKRLVLVSEPTHGTHETRLMNAKVVRFLVERDGVRTLIPELGYGEGLELDAYVRRGVGDADRIVKNDLGILWNTTEEAEMMRWIAGWNKAHPKDMVRVVGMDVEAGTAAGLALAKLVAGTKLDAGLVARVKAGAEAADAMKGPANVGSAGAPASAGEKKASTDYDAALVELLAATKGRPESADVWRSAMSVRSGRRVVEMRMEGKDGADAGSRLREFEMARMALTAMAESSAPAVIVTHTVHLRAGRLTPQDRVQTVGYHLARALGDRAFFLGEEYGVGSMRAFVPTMGGEPAGAARRLHAAVLDAPAAGSMAGALGTGVSGPGTLPGGTLLIDLRDPRDGSAWSEWLESLQATHLYPAITYEAGDASKPNWTVPADAFDALIYIPEVKPLKPIGEPEYVP